MSKYRNLAMDLADTSLVVLADERRITTVFAVDRDVRVYRLPRRQPSTIVP